MRILLPGLLLALAACSSGDGDAAGNIVSNTVPVATPAAAATPATAATDSGAAPKLGEQKTFRDWTVGCDNVGRCQADALTPEGADQPAILASVTRDGGPDGAITVAVLSSEALGVPLSFLVDGRPVGSGGVTEDDATRLRGAAADAIARAIANGRALAVRDAAGHELGTISLAGASAALRYMDAEQGRANTAGALVAKGADTSLPPAPAAPTIVAVQPAGTPASLSAAQIAALRKQAGCEPSMLPEPAAAPDYAALGGGTTLVLLPCDAGAYNLIAAVYVVTNGKAAPARFDAPTGFSPDPQPVPSVVNGRWKDGLLHTYAKGRGLGDCGSMQQFAWDGRRFRLADQHDMGECRGNTDYIRSWHAAVVRR